MDASFKEDDVLSVYLPEIKLSTMPDVSWDRESWNVSVVQLNRVFNFFCQAFVATPKHNSYINFFYV